MFYAKLQIYVCNIYQVNKIWKNGLYLQNWFLEMVFHPESQIYNIYSVNQFWKGEENQSYQNKNFW